MRFVHVVSQELNPLRRILVKCDEGTALLIQICESSEILLAVDVCFRAIEKVFPV